MSWADVPPRSSTLYTIGHGTLEAGRFAELLAASGVKDLVDVRKMPASRRNPHFTRPEIEAWLSERDVRYRWEPALGGFRRPDANSPNTGLRNRSFRGYADHMTTAGFRAALDRLLSDAAASPTAIMCAEAVWWRCHRRLISDASVLVARFQVFHIAHDGRVQEHIVTEGAEVAGVAVRYPGARTQMSE